MQSLKPRPSAPPHDRSLLARGDCRRLVVSTAQASAFGEN